MRIKQTESLRVIVDGVIIHRITRKAVSSGLFGMSRHRLAFEWAISEMEAGRPEFTGFAGRYQEWSGAPSVDIQVDLMR